MILHETNQFELIALNESTNRDVTEDTRKWLDGERSLDRRITKIDLATRGKLRINDESEKQRAKT